MTDRPQKRPREAGEARPARSRGGERAPHMARVRLTKMVRADTSTS